MSTIKCIWYIFAIDFVTHKSNIYYTGLSPAAQNSTANVFQQGIRSLVAIIYLDKCCR